ncbi:MAG: tetratricopeptide repeat protein [Alphaproteobacteria bacterium]|nr:tetratricopeptide repeat protein [Alphaproteobacteria bacterium]
MKLLPVSRAVSVAVCAALILALAGCGSPQQKEARYIRKGNAFFASGDYEKARLEYQNAAHLQPAAAEPAYRLGLVYEAEGDFVNAFADFTVAEQQDKHFHPAILKIAQYDMAAGREDIAQARVAAVLAEAPGDAEAHAIMAALLLREKKYAEAEKEARQALAIDPANVTACSALTGLYTAEGDIDKATAAVDDGIARNPKNIALLILRAAVFEKTGDLAKTAQAYDAIFKFAPDDIKFRQDLAGIYIKAGNLDAAEAALRAGVAALPDNWDMKRALVSFLADHRGAGAAENEIHALMQAWPQNDDLYFWLADLYAAHGDADHAVALLQSVVGKAPDSQSALDARAMIAGIDIKRGNKGLAQKLVATVLASQPDNRAALFIRANLEYQDGYYQSAVADLRSILLDAPNDPDALDLLAETLLAQGHGDLAVDTMKKRVALDPGNIARQVRLAQMLHLNGDNDEALALIGQITAANPGYAVGWESAARIAIDAKDWLPAQAAVRKLDTLDGQHLTAAFLDGQILAANGKDAGAIAQFKTVIDADPASPLAGHALKALVESYRRLGDPATAAAYLQTLSPDSPLIETLIGACDGLAGNAAASAAAFDKAIATNAAPPEAYLDRAKIYLDAQQPDLAAAVLRQGMQAAPQDFRAPMALAQILASQGRYHDADALYDDMLARNPDFIPAANNQAEMIADALSDDSAELEKARQRAERFAGSDNPALLDTLAWVYFRQGNIAMAQTLMERIRTHAGLPPQIHYHDGAILAKAGQTAQARAELQLATAQGANYPGIDQARQLLATLP